MSRLLAPAPLVALHLTLAGLIVVWNLWVAGRTAQLRDGSRDMILTSALIALTLPPAIFVVITSSYFVAGRALNSVAWVWPVALVLVTVHTILALVRGRVLAAIGLPLLVYNLILTLTAIARHIHYRGITLPDALLQNPVVSALLALPAAQADALAIAVHPLAIVRPYLLFVPILAPVTVGRRRSELVLRGALAAFAVAWTTLIVVGFPGALRAIRSYETHANDVLTERPEADFSIGVKLFPRLEGGVPTLAFSSDLALVDTLDPRVVSVYLAPRGTVTASLDSLARVLESRRPGRLVVAVLDLSAVDTRIARGARERWLMERVPDVERIVRRLRPDVVVPVLDPFGGTVNTLGPMSPETWIRYLTASHEAVRAVNRRVEVMAHVGGFSASDSTLFAWAAHADTPLDAVSVSVSPAYEGGDGLEARLRAVSRWLRTTGTTKPVWVLEASGYPVMHGERAHERALWRALTWGTATPQIQGMVVLSAADHDEPRGLRAPGGRIRPATFTVRRAIRALEETVQPPDRAPPTDARVVEPTPP